MTTTAEALEAAAAGLARIDHALAVQDATDHGDADWLPGDPLYARPRGHLMGEQHIRPMFQMLADVEWLRARCEPCDVSWAGDAPCWVCGTERPGATEPRHVHYSFGVDVEQAREQMASMREQMRVLSEQVQEQIDERVIRLLEERVLEQSQRGSLNDVRWSFAPAVADPLAPTVAELASAVPVDGLFDGIFLRPEPEPVLDPRLADVDPAEHRDRPVTIRPPDPDDTVTRRGFFGEVTLARARYPRPDAVPVLGNQENP